MSKMFSRRKKNPPPPIALSVLKQTCHAAEIKHDVWVLEDGVLLQFNQEVEMVLMTSRGARLLAARLVKCAEELEAGS